MAAQAFTIHPVAALDDNYIWTVSRNGQAVCIDPGEAGPVLDYLHRHGLSLAEIWITHHHHDHTGGIAGLKQVFPQCTVYGNRDIAAADRYAGEGVQWLFGGCRVEVWHTPGHTAGHLSYLLHDAEGLHVFCGDTLFSAGCGRVFCGTAGQLYVSLQRYAGLPGHTLFYPAHEYTAANLRFAACVEPDNPAVRTARAAAEHMPTLPVSLAHELRINPFLRTGGRQVAQKAAEYSGGKLADGAAVFAALREWKNRF
ncbi:hydroxyacylglutathione hydrolase [Neisseria musculi]|uniref:Hydroxyacylglutathione hydrolase n=1 Tax=Neisseria musculi TaxID=1815583 RepID=A0A7H1M9G2_9NEIS|nr:hydroxyacylglutathione hydrolase [Neisseria musculi]QNT58277.1 hydroxyacylglutathione hydrolase [Neisseria musculi]